MKFGEIFKRRETEKPEIIHPSFGILDEVDEGRYWYWNFVDFSQYLKSIGRSEYYKATDMIKVAFAFDDPALLDECPYLCKIGKNLVSDTKFFGVAYELNERAEELKNWASKFSRSELLDYFSNKIEV